MIVNRKAYHDYTVEEKLECGIELRGNEVKSIREGRASIKEAYAKIHNGELFLTGMHITRWGTANNFDVVEKRDRKLLVHKSELRKLQDWLKDTGMTLIPLSVYDSKRGKIKVELGVCRGKHNYDKRRALKERQIRRDIARGEAV